MIHIVCDDVHHLVVAAAAAGGALGHSLELLEGLLHVLKAFAAVQGVDDIKIADLLAVANHPVFHLLFLLETFSLNSI